MIMSKVILSFLIRVFMCFITIFIYFILGLNYMYVLCIYYVACHLVSQFSRLES